MRAAVLTGRRALEVIEQPLVEPGPDEVEVEVAFCGICGTDLHAYSELLFPVGSVLGHECSGVVAAVGAEVDHLAVGERVVVRPSFICGKCEYCLRGDFRLCPQHFEQTVGAGAPGAFAERVVVKGYMARDLPAAVPFEAATLIEPLACALHAVRISGMRLGDRVAVYGAGPIGLLVFAAARLAGAVDVVVVERSAVRRAAVHELGEATVCTLEDLNSAPAWFREHGADVSFECAGAQATVDAAITHARRGGTVVFESLYDQPPAVDLPQALPKELRLQTALGSTATEFDAAIDLMASGALSVGSLITSIVGLSDIDKAFRALHDGPDAVKILVQPNGAG